MAMHKTNDVTSLSRCSVLGSWPLTPKNPSYYLARVNLVGPTSQLNYDSGTQDDPFLKSFVYPVPTPVLTSEQTVPFNYERVTIHSGRYIVRVMNSTCCNQA